MGIIWVQNDRRWEPASFFSPYSTNGFLSFLLRFLRDLDSTFSKILDKILAHFILGHNLSKVSSHLLSRSEKCCLEVLLLAQSRWKWTGRKLGANIAQSSQSWKGYDKPPNQKLTGSENIGPGTTCERGGQDRKYLTCSTIFRRDRNDNLLVAFRLERLNLEIYYLLYEINACKLQRGI
jgi:hypothetical protein